MFRFGIVLCLITLSVCQNCTLDTPTNIYMSGARPTADETRILIKLKNPNAKRFYEKKEVDVIFNTLTQKLENKKKDDDPITLSIQEFEFTQNYLAYVDTNNASMASYFAIFNASLNMIMNVTVQNYYSSPNAWLWFVSPGLGRAFLFHPNASVVVARSFLIANPANSNVRDLDYTALSILFYDELSVYKMKVYDDAAVQIVVFPDSNGCGKIAYYYDATSFLPILAAQAAYGGFIDNRTQQWVGVNSPLQLIFSNYTTGEFTTVDFTQAELDAFFKIQWWWLLLIALAVLLVLIIIIVIIAVAVKKKKKKDGDFY